MNIHGDALCTLWNYNGNIHSLQSLLLSGTESSEAVTLTIISGYTLLLQRTPRLQLYSCIVSQGFLPWKIWVAFPRESQLRQSHTTKPTVHVGCFKRLVTTDPITQQAEAEMEVKKDSRQTSQDLEYTRQRERLTLQAVTQSAQLSGHHRQSAVLSLHRLLTELAHKRNYRHRQCVCNAQHGSFKTRHRRSVWKKKKTSAG